MERLDGRALSKELRGKLKSRIDDWTSSGKPAPCLAVVLVGDDPASQVYVSHKIKACAEAGVKSVEKRLPVRTNIETLLTSSWLSSIADPSVHGISGATAAAGSPSEPMKTRSIATIDPLKDSDGLAQC
jgi:methylenetetrahydrofolate dehydrogenase (NADP+)/methenyltetrahydrofolate cyclohydrolase